MPSKFNLEPFSSFQTRSLRNTFPAPLPAAAFCFPTGAIPPVSSRDFSLTLLSIFGQKQERNNLTSPQSRKQGSFKADFRRQQDMLTCDEKLAVGSANEPFYVKIFSFMKKSFISPPEIPPALPAPVRNSGEIISSPLSLSVG